MAKQPLKTEQTSDRQVNKLQKNVAEATAILRGSPMADGVLITGITFAGFEFKKVSHGLGRAYQGFIVVKHTGTAGSTNGFPPFIPTANLSGPLAQPDPTKYIYLYSYDPATFDIWVW